MSTESAESILTPRRQGGLTNPSKGEVASLYARQLRAVRRRAVNRELGKPIVSQARASHQLLPSEAVQSRLSWSREQPRGLRYTVRNSKVCRACRQSKRPGADLRRLRPFAPRYPSRGYPGDKEF